MAALKSHLFSGLTLILWFSGCLYFSALNAQTQAQRPNVLLIMIDDLNDCIEGMEGHRQALTPNMLRLAQSGVSFRRAYTNAPMCGPSRASLFTGIYPHHSGNFFQSPWFNFPTLSHTRTMMEQFKMEAYQVLGTGKIMHHNQNELWTHFGNAADYGPSPFNGEHRIPHPEVPTPFSEIGWVDGSLGPFVDLSKYTNAKGESLYWVTGNQKKGFSPMHYRNDQDRDPTPDEKNALWACSRLQDLANDSSNQAFFMAVGFLRPHTPLVAPQKYFDRFPLDQLELAAIKFQDEKDTHLKMSYQGDVFTLKMGTRMFEAIAKAYGSAEAGLKIWTQAYLACVAAVDDNVGHILDAIDESGLADNTIVVLASDHGFHMGEKDYLYKNSLWEESTRIPLLIRAPGITKAGTYINHPVSLIDLYPTLLDLCNLSTQTQKDDQGHPLDGHSMVPLLRRPSLRKWEGTDAALSVVYAGSATLNDPSLQHYAIRTKRYRYILYNNGQEELYDHQKDPYEWVNIASHSGRPQRILLHMRTKLTQMIYPTQLVGLSKIH